HREHGSRRPDVAWIENGFVGDGPAVAAIELGRKKQRSRSVEARLDGFLVRIRAELVKLDEDRRRETRDDRPVDLGRQVGPEGEEQRQDISTPGVVDTAVAVTQKLRRTADGLAMTGKITVHRRETVEVEAVLLPRHGVLRVVPIAVADE